MDFSNVVFLFYFLPLFLVAHFVTPKNSKTSLGVAAGLWFFVWSAGWFVFIIIGLILLDYWLIDGLNKKDGEKRKFYLISSLILNLSLLVYYKYASAISNSQLDINMTSGGWESLIVPLGIGFFTLQKIGYAIDVYRNEGKHFNNIVDYAFYILFFPKLISGPFVQLKSFGTQIEKLGENENLDSFITGCVRFSKGLAKKVLIANSLAPFVTEIFQNLGSVSSGQLWLALLAFAFQIFFDFSGYVDMAIGISQMIGLRLPEKFHSPYTSTSVSSFWKNWHTTFYLWLKNYLYLPLCGSKENSSIRLLMNILIVIILAGMWHGITAPFLIFALYHAFFMLIEKLGAVKILEKIGKTPSMIYTFCVILIGWAIFKSSSVKDLILLSQNLFGMSNNTYQFAITTKEITILIVAIFLSFRRIIPKIDVIKITITEKIGHSKFQLTRNVSAILLLIVSVSYLATEEFIPFIYSKF